MKPLGHKAYGSIPHLPSSRLGEGDHHCEQGQARIATEKVRDRKDLVIVQEKLDGANVAIAKIDNRIIALSRSGYTATTSPYQQHHVFDKWVKQNETRFTRLLKEGERICGEWLYQAHGTKYDLSHEPFVPFDIMTGTKRINYHDFIKRVLPFRFTIPNLLHIGGSFKIDEAMKSLVESGHGAIDPVEGAVWRIEREKKVDFLCKYVRHDKQDGKYLPEISGSNPEYNTNAIKYIK